MSENNNDNKEKNKKKGENKICFILHSISATLFTLSGILNIVSDGFTNWSGFTNIALGVTFGSLAYIYYKRYKQEK